MDITTKQLLNLLSAAMGTKQVDMIDLQETDWNKLFSLAHIHNIVPMIYEAGQKTQSFSQAAPELAVFWRKLAIEVSISQMYRTMDFLQLYDKLNQEGIQALVIKGMICRELYPNPYNRSSGDEDVYIKKADFDKVDSIFQNAGLIRDKNKNWDNSLEQVTTYQSAKHDLIIELHVDLFPAESELFGPMNKLFDKAFEDSISETIEGVPIHTLSHNMHLLFLILHCIKHFLAMGFGIRQVSDMVMYINTYGKEIDWQWIWKQVSELSYDILLLNLLDIGYKYLGLNQEKLHYPDKWSSSDIHSEALLEDIMKAGIFGKSEPGQVKSSSMTLNAISKDRKSRRAKGKLNVLKTMFPGLDYMSSHYTYCSKYPFLLPFAWFHRFGVYAAEERNLNAMISKAGNSFAIGRKRIELLKEYKVIGR